MYESKRITISFPAVERLTQAYGLPNDLPSQTLAGYVERLIFECLCKLPSTSKPEQTIAQSAPQQALQPNMAKLASLAKNKGLPNNE